MSKSPDTDISEVRERLALVAADDAHAAYYKFGEGDMERRAALRSDLRALLSDHAGLVAEVERLKRERDNLGESLQRETRYRVLAEDRAETAESALAASKAEREALVEGLDRLASTAECTPGFSGSGGLSRAVAEARALISKTGEG